MAITTNTHLNFRGDARQALGFYQSVFGGHLTAVAYSDFGMPKRRKIVGAMSVERT